tara:strand:+ start:249 stop:626 length:378 start_codon:yes stop_codon:yes gene_type:complete
MIEWKELAAIGSLLVVWSAGSLWAIKVLITSQLATHRAYTDEKFESLVTLITKQGNEIQKFERDLMTLKAELPDKYVRREDWIRFAATLDAKMDGLREAQNNTNLRFASLSEKMSNWINGAKHEQ